jgi:hypothetical protein
VTGNWIDVARYEVTSFRRACDPGAGPGVNDQAAGGWAGDKPPTRLGATRRMSPDALVESYEAVRSGRDRTVLWAGARGRRQVRPGVLVIISGESARSWTFAGVTSAPGTRTKACREGRAGGFGGRRGSRQPQRAVGPPGATATAARQEEACRGFLRPRSDRRRAFRSWAYRPVGTYAARAAAAVMSGGECLVVDERPTPGPT